MQKKRPYYIAGNWKMHKTSSEAATLAGAVATKLGSSDHRIMVAPPFTALAAVSQAVSSTAVRLGAQNMAAEEEGAHTGEISPLMLTDLGVETVILGHSERRTLYGEEDETINKKVHLALTHGLEVILCVGETLEERERGDAESIVEKQLELDLDGIDQSALARVVIAYEPVWAIGTGKTATPQDADAMHGFIRNRVGAWYSPEAADGLVIQYGGSVKPGNAAELLAMENIDGALVGGASLDADSFAAIAQAAR